MLFKNFERRLAPYYSLKMKTLGSKSSFNMFNVPMFPLSDFFELLKKVFKILETLIELLIYLILLYLPCLLLFMYFKVDMIVNNNHGQLISRLNQTISEVSTHLVTIYSAVFFVDKT